MTNGEKFPTAEERARAYQKFCSSSGMGCNKCPLKKVSSVRCPFEWLNLEYKEELKKCPFCGGEARIVYTGSSGETLYFVECKKCFGKTVSKFKKNEAIEAWNRRA